MIHIRNHIPKGIIKNNSIIAKTGKGCWVWDKYDNKYLDMTSGIGALSTGHCHPNIVKNVKKQLIDEMKNSEIFKSVTDKFPDAELIDVNSNKDGVEDD